MASIDDTLDALVAEAGADTVARLRGAPFDAARAQRLFDALTGQRELTPPPAPRAPELSDPPDEASEPPPEVRVEAPPEPEPSEPGPPEAEQVDDGEDHEDDFVEIDDDSIAGSMNADDLDDDSGAEFTGEVLIDDGIAVEAADELASQIEELASQHGAMRDVLEDSVDHESIDEFFADDDELEDSFDGDDDTGTVQVKLPEEHEAPKPDRKKGMRSSVKKLFRK